MDGIIKRRKYLDKLGTMYSLRTITFADEYNRTENGSGGFGYTYSIGNAKRGGRV